MSVTGTARANEPLLGRECGQSLGMDAGNELEHVLGNRSLLALAETRVHRQGNYFLRNSFRDRETALFIGKVSVGFLQVQRNRIVDRRADVRLAKMLLQRNAILNANHVEMVNRFGPGRFARQNDSLRRTEQLLISSRAFAPLLRPLGEVL